MSPLKRSFGTVSDRTLNRAIVGLVALLAIGLPAMAIFYYADRHVDGGPSMAQRAIIAAEEAVRAEPNKMGPRLALAAAYVADGRTRDALVQYDEVLGADAANRVALLGRGDAYRVRGELAAAQHDDQAMVDIARGGEMARADLQLEAAYYGIGAIALRQDRPRDAATHLADALRIDRTDADALDLMGQALIGSGDVRGAIDALRDAVTLVPTGWCDPYAHLAEAYTALGETAGATYASGMVAFCDGRRGEAEALLEPLVDGPFARDALIGLGLIAEDRSDRDAAAAFYARVYAMDPNDFAAISGLGRVEADAPTTAPAGPTAPPAGQP